MVAVVVSERDEFAAFVRARGSQLLRAGWLLCGNWSSAEDLVQVGLAAVWRHWNRIDRVDSPETYAHRVMVNAYLRDRRRRWRFEVPFAEVDQIAGTDRVDHRHVRAEAQAETRDVLLRAMDRLPPRQRAVLVLRYFFDLTERQSADTLGCSTGTVKSHSARAIAALRKSGLLDELTIHEAADQ